MNAKAISPVIATVIIVSVAIAIAVAVAFWMTGITGLFTRYEKLEVINAYATKPDNIFNITIYVKNTGSSDATVDSIFVNGKPPSQANVINITAVTDTTSLFFNTTNFTRISVSVPTGKSATFAVVLNGTYYGSGQIVEVKLHTAAGNEYPKSVQLP